MVGAAQERQCLYQSPRGLAVELRLVHCETPSQFSSLTSQMGNRTAAQGAVTRHQLQARRCTARRKEERGGGGMINVEKTRLASLGSPRLLPLGAGERERVHRPPDF